MANLPTFSQIVSNMIAFFQARRPNAFTSTGSVINDVVISGPANEFANVTYPAIQNTQNLQAFVDNASSLNPSDLNAIGANYNLTRLPGTAATGIITFRIRNYTFSSPIITVNSGTTVSTLATSSSPAISFATTATITFLPSLAPSYFNPVTGFYEQTAPIICQTIGVVGNVGSATITSLVSSVPGIDSVINITTTTGGTDQESNTAFATRIQIKLSGNNVGTPNGIISLVDTNPNVQQSIIVGPNDPEMIRNQFGGSVDVYIKGQVLTTLSDFPTYSTTGSQIFILAHQPASSIGSVTGIVSGLPHTFIAGTDYNVHVNPNILFAGSIEAGSYIQFNIGGTNPDNNTVITITYTYDSLIETLQALFNNDSNHIVASDILIREAIQAIVSVTTFISIIPGFIFANVQNSVRTNLSNFINGLGLGGSFFLSDLVAIIQDTSGVSEVDLSTLSINVTINAVTTSYPLNGQKVLIPRNTFAVPGSFVISQL